MRIDRILVCGSYSVKNHRTCICPHGWFFVINKLTILVNFSYLYIENGLNRALGTGQPLFNMNSGSLHASLDRVELILTHTTEFVPDNQVPPIY